MLLRFGPKEVRQRTDLPGARTLRPIPDPRTIQILDYTHAYTYHTIPYHTLHYPTLRYTTTQTYMHTYLHTYIYTYLPTYLHSYLHIYPNEREREIERERVGNTQSTCGYMWCLLFCLVFSNLYHDSIPPNVTMYLAPAGLRCESDGGAVPKSSLFGSAVATVGPEPTLVGEDP